MRDHPIDVPGAFRPLGAVADELALRAADRCGNGGQRIVRWLRSHGGVRTLSEIWEEIRRPPPELEATLEALEGAGLVIHRDMIIGAVSERVWWAPLSVTVNPENAPWI
ncbi:helix-turn-helix domain-containing protein [Cereibacter sphaeroides]|nr:helix-turn-helix domain-containing protein [Cereibacter sphaeroides]